MNNDRIGYASVCRLYDNCPQRARICIVQSGCAVSGVEINEGGRGIQMLFWQLFPYFPIFLESLLCGQKREKDVNGS